MKIIFSILLGAAAFYFIGCAANNSDKPTTPKDKIAAVAKAYGMDSLQSAHKISFTFNLKKDTISFARSWVWDKDNNVVTLSSDKENVTYKRDTIQSDEMKKVDQKFINDEYWLLFPYHAANDSGVTYEMKDSVKSPVSGALATKITVQYKKDGGYTPGDAYDLYVDKNNMVTEWSYRPGGVADPAMSTTWADNKKEKGMTMAMDHKNAAGDFRIFFTGVTVE